MSQTETEIDRHMKCQPGRIRRSSLPLCQGCKSTRENIYAVHQCCSAKPDCPVSVHITIFTGLGLHSTRPGIDATVLGTLWKLARKWHMFLFFTVCFISEFLTSPAAQTCVNGSNQRDLHETLTRANPKYSCESFRVRQTSHQSHRKLQSSLDLPLRYRGMRMWAGAPAAGRCPAVVRRAFPPTAPLLPEHWPSPWSSRRSCWGRCPCISGVR